MWPFGRKVKLEVTDEEKAKQDFIKDRKRNPPTTQRCFRTFMKYHRLGEVYHPEFIYCLFQGRLLKIRR